MELADCRGVPDSLIDAGEDLEAAAAFFVSYAFLHDALDQALPVSPRLVKAYLWNLLQCSYKPGTVTLHIYAILDRHRAYAAPFPFSTRSVKHIITAFE
eukprot:2488110-Rhodomonas_salina.1